MADCLIALGANLGEPQAMWERAQQQVAALPGTQMIRVSQPYVTHPVGGPERQPKFLNGAVRLHTDLSPAGLLAELHQIEAEAGRRRDEHWAARTLDLDLLLYDQQEVATPQLVLPHQRMSYRRFVLEPAAEIAGEMLHPPSGWTLAQLLAHLVETPPIVAIGGENQSVSDRLRQALGREVPDYEIKAYDAQMGRVASRPRLVVWIGDSPTSQVLAGPTACLPLPGSTDEAAWEAMQHEVVAALLAASRPQE